MSIVRIKDMTPDDRPRERIIEVGSKNLSDYELIAILLRTGNVQESAIGLAQRILKEKNGLHGLSKLSVRELLQMEGLGDAKAASLIAALELGRRIHQRGIENRGIIREASDVYGLVGERLRAEQQEVFEVLFLDAKNKVLGKSHEISRGGLASCPVEPALIFREGALRNSLSVILIHNHPSGDPHPSREDIQLTYRIVEAGEMIGIKVLDHVIVGDGRWISFQESGLLDV
jgi:DNA repair protein radc